MRLVFMVLSLFITGCATRTDMNGLKKDQEDSRRVLDQVESKVGNIPKLVLYEIYDIHRGKSVGWVGVGVHISTGDRIFLNDDIWEVKAVKLFTSPSGNAKELNNAPIFSVTYIQVLATFGGKATDPNTKG